MARGSIEIRADAGFAVPALYDYCEREGISYTIALITNERLKEMAHDLLEEATQEHERTDKKATLFGEALYGAASWERERRVVYKAEAMEQGTNRRFVVTTKRDAPEELYGFYAKRGESENWIKDFKVHVKADRLSCHRFVANQFRLLLHAAAYWLMDALRRKLIESGGHRRMQLDILRLTLIKIGGRVRELMTKVRLHLATGHPGQPLWHDLSLAFEEFMNNSARALLERTTSTRGFHSRRRSRALTTGPYPPPSVLVLIHPSAWKVDSPKSACTSVHRLRGSGWCTKP